MTGEPSVVKNTWPLLVTLTEFAWTGAAAVPPPGLRLSVGRVVSAGPLAGANGTLILLPVVIDRTSKS